MRRRLSWLLCLLALAGGAAARTPAQQAEHWLRIGYDRPDAAFAALALAQAEAPAQARLWQRTRAWVAARAGRDQELAAALEALRQLPAPQQPLAAADAQLAHALQAEQRGQSVQASTHAQMASDTYARLCARGDAADCDRGGAVMALLLQARRDGEEGDLSAAAERASEAVALAQRGACWRRPRRCCARPIGPTSRCASPCWRPARQTRSATRRGMSAPSTRRCTTPRWRNRRAWSRWPWPT
jgi:hypothetical protein